MPIYEYRCKECGKGFEKLLLSLSEQVACPYCKSGSLEKMMSACNTVGSDKGSAECAAADYCPSAGCCGGGPCRH